MKALQFIKEFIISAVALFSAVVLFGEPVEGSVLDNGLIIILTKLAAIAVLILIISRLAEKIKI